MHQSLREETVRLVRSWAQHEAAWLGSYLVAGVEDPRINLQSILSRHFLTRDLTSQNLSPLMSEEYRFSACMNWLRKLAGAGINPEEQAAVLYALKRGSDNAEGLEIPLFLVQTFAQLPKSMSFGSVPNYIEQFLSPCDRADAEGAGVEKGLNTFQQLWQECLSPGRFEFSRDAMSGSDQVPTVQPSLLEPACGSANDYRFLHSYGIAQRFAYTGFDLSADNVKNSHSLFPGICFQVGNVFQIEADDKTYDLCMVHDLLEHLSIEGMERAVSEICRVTRRGICIGFFQMDEIRDHVVRPVDEYHFNVLSMKKTRELFRQHGFDGQVVHIGSFLDEQVGCADTHNPNAYTFLLRADV